MGSFKRIGKRIISGVLCFVMSLTFVASMPKIVAHADSNTRMQVNIEWAQKKGFDEMTDEDFSSFTYDDLRMIGVFLSNFYVPFSTCIGASVSEEDTEATKENMIKILENQCNFDSDVAEFLVPLIWEMSLSSAKPLNIGKYNSSNGSVESVVYTSDDLAGIVPSYNAHFGNENAERLLHYSDGGDIFYNGSYYNFLVTFAGGAQTKNKDDKAINFVWDGDRQDACLFWKDDSGNKHVVLDARTSLCPAKGNWDDSSRRKAVMSASVLAYAMLNDSLAYGYGIGNSLFSVESYKEFKALDKSDLKTSNITSSQLYVDCFGNILLDWAGMQYVIFPACTNPYAWYDTFKDGVDAENPSTAGKNINLVNTYFLSEAELGNITVEDIGTDTYSTTSFSDFLIDEQESYVLGRLGKSNVDKAASLYIYDGTNSLMNTYYMRKYLGDTDCLLDNKTFGNSDETKDLWKALKNGVIIEEDADGEENDYVRMPNFGTYSGSLTSVSGHLGHDYLVAKLPMDSNVSVFEDMCMIDSVGAMSDSSITTQLLFDPETNNFLRQTGLSGKMQFSSIKSKNKMVEVAATTNKAYTVSIYLSYVYAYYDTNEGEDRKVRWAYNKNAFPSMSENVDFSSIEISSTALYDETLSLVNLFLHPSKGIKVVTTWFRNKISGILLGWHEDMVGKAGAASTTGSTKYVGFSGYVTLPSLNDLEWTAFMMNTYDQLVVYFIIIILIILLGYKMIGTLSWQKVVLSGLLFAVCAYLPPRLINATVDASNQICNSFYGDKFTYWALVQHEQYASALNSAIEEENEWNYLATVFNNQADTASESYALVTVKWQCPKKENYWADVKEEITSVSNNRINKLIMQTVRDTISGESYTEAADNQYLYRSYTDLGTYANSLYTNGSMVSIVGSGDNPQSDQSASTVTFEGLYASLASKNISIDNDNSDAKDRWLQAYRNPYFAGSCASLASGKSQYGTKTATSALQAIRLGFNFDTVRTTEHMLVGGDTSIAGSTRYNTNRRLTDFSYCGSVNFAWSRGLSGMLYKVSGGGAMSQISHDFLKYNPVYGVPLEVFNTTLSDVNGRADGSLGGVSVQEYRKDSDVSALVFANYTESPFMYFSYNLSDQLGAAQKRNEASSYKDLFLLKDGGYFYNMLTVGSSGSDVNTVMENGAPASDGYGELRDYMDIRSLFYVVIPYLKSINDVVIDYDNTYGLFMYDGVTLEYDDKNNIVLPDELKDLTDQTPYHGNSDLSTTAGESYYKYIHNWEVAQLLNMYTPWVDVMYDCGYANGENIYVLGEKFYVKDPLDPLSYYEQDARGNIIAGREMVFSRSEMAYYGLSMEDLTQVEQKIITMSDNCYEDLLQIIDYYNFQPEVLNTAIAMMETFEFNRQFSETSVFGTDHVLYPQNYELKNFSYDAYLRLILAGTTGEDLNNLEDADIYSTVVKNSSILTALLMILLDLFTVYAIPALKLFFIIGIFFMSILMILVATIRLEVKLSKALGESLVFPLLKFFGVTVGMAWIVSLFMYDGNTAVTGRTSRIISLGDPTMAIIVMLVLNIAVLILYWKICKGVFKDCKKYAQAVGTSVGGMFGGAVAMLGAGVGMGMIMSRKGNGSSGSKILPKRKNNGDSDGSGGNGSGSGGGKGNGSSGVTAGASGGGNGSGGGTPAFNADGTANKMDKNGNFVKPKKNKKTETSAHNKYDDKIDKAKTKAKAKTDRQMDKLAAKEDVNVKRQWLENNLRSHAQYDEHMSDRQRARYNKKADKLKAQREKSTNKINRDFDRLANKEEKRNGKLNTKVDKLQKKSAVRSEKISRDVTNKSFKKAVKESKKKSRVAGKKK